MYRRRSRVPRELRPRPRRSALSARSRQLSTDRTPPGRTESLACLATKLILVLSLSAARCLSAFGPWQKFRFTAIDVRFWRCSGSLSHWTMVQLHIAAQIPKTCIALRAPSYCDVWRGDLVHTMRSVLIGLVSIIAVCGVALFSINHPSGKLRDFIEWHPGFSPDGGDGWMEIPALVALATKVAAIALSLRSPVR